jgi:hypothetical protein
MAQFIVYENGKLIELPDICFSINLAMHLSRSILLNFFLLVGICWRFKLSYPRLWVHDTNILIF